MSTENIPDIERLVGIVEALLFASGETVRMKDLAAVVDGVEIPQVEEALSALAERYQRENAGLRVEHVGGGVQLATRSDVGPWVRQLLRNRNRTRISVAESLATRLLTFAAAYLTAAGSASDLPWTPAYPLASRAGLAWTFFA